MRNAMRAHGRLNQMFALAVFWFELSIAATCTECTVGVDYQPQAGRTSCISLKVCASGQRITVAPTISSNRQCQDCGLGFVSASQNSQDCTECDGVFKYSDQLQASACKDVDTCTAGQREAVSPDKTRNRQCTREMV